MNHQFWYHRILLSSHTIPHTHTTSVHMHQIHLCKLRSNVLLDWIIVCDVQCTFCRLLSVSLARPSVGLPAHYGMLITSHQVTWNCWTTLFHICVHGKHRKLNLSTAGLEKISLGRRLFLVKKILLFLSFMLYMDRSLLAWNCRVHFFLLRKSMVSLTGLN